MPQPKRSKCIHSASIIKEMDDWQVNLSIKFSAQGNKSSIMRKESSGIVVLMTI